MKEGICVVEVPQSTHAYRYVRLENGLDVLLVSDPKTEMSAAAMCCQVGSGQDPDEVLGLAHFTEHMMFLGTEKYPQEDSYSNFISENGGSNNAYTAFDATNFYFSVKSGALDGSLDRFAQFFIAPLFTASATEREICAVESENQRAHSRDFFVFDMFLKETMRPAHPKSRFAVGNTDTLKNAPAEKGIDVREHLFAFQKHYSSRLMKLCVIGRETLDELYDMVAPKFSPVRDKGATEPECPWVDLPPLDPSKLGKMYYVKCVRTEPRLHLVWEVAGGTQFYKAAPTHYLTHLLGHECEGSILKVLKDRNLASQLTCGAVQEVSKVFVLLEIEIYLTPEGYERVSDVLSVVFQYLALLRDTGLSVAHWKEVSDTAEMRFRFQQEGKPEDEVVQNALNMTKYEPQHVLSGDHRMFTMDTERITSIIRGLTPRNAVIAVKRSSFDDVDVPVALDRMTDHYGVEYGVMDIASETLDSWHESRDRDPSLAMPPLNKFVPDNFDLVPPLPVEEPREPKLVYRTPVISDVEAHESAPPADLAVYHWQGDTFKAPKVAVAFHVMSPVAYQSPAARFMTRVFAKLLVERTNTCCYYALVADLDMSANATTEGIEVHVRGFSQKVPVLMEEVWSLFDAMEVTSDLFDMCKEQEIQAVQNLLKAQAWQQADKACVVATYTSKWSGKDVLQAGLGVDLQDMRHFIKAFREHGKLSMCTVGNITAQGAKDLAEVVRSKYLHRSKGLPKCMWPASARVVKYPEGSATERNWILPTRVDASVKTSAVLMSFQCEARSPKIIALVDVFTRVTSSLFFSTLRTKEQLGYVVHSSARAFELVESCRFIVESATCSPWYVYGRMHHFLAALGPWLRSLPDETFQSVVASEIDIRKEKPPSAVKQLDAWWTAITQNHFQFDFKQRVTEALKVLTMDDLISFFDTYISPSSSKRRCLTTFAYSQKDCEELDSLTEQWKRQENPAEGGDATCRLQPSLLVTRELEPWRDVVKEAKPALSDGAKELIALVRSGAAPPNLKQIVDSLNLASELAGVPDLPAALAAVVAPAEDDADSSALQISKGEERPSLPVGYIFAHAHWKLPLECFPTLPPSP